MAVYSDDITINTDGEVEIVDITEKIEEIVSESNVAEGIACVFVPGSTGVVTTIEHEPGLLQDLPQALEKLAPKGIHYKHHETWQDGNGHSHVRASIMGPSLTVPIREGSLVHGTWQQIVFVELDVRSRQRKIMVQIVGD